jgi:hypothetical protein
MPNTRTIDAVATNGTSPLSLGIGNTGSSLFLNASNILFNIGGSERMRIDSTGRTLIGTSFTNGYSLEIFTSLGARVGSNGKLSINSSGNVEVDASGVVAGRFIINSSGNVGIANSLPGTYRLNINGTGFLNASAWVYSSDRRIKNNILDISDNNALQQILLIQPKTYEYIDKENWGSNIVYGFIAQQIKEVIPHAVNIQKEIIPNIYKSFNCLSNIINIDPSIYNLNSNDIIGIRKKNNFNLITECTITNINTEINQITIDKDLEENECLVYGTKVDDFHAIKKEYIYTLNVCATQELYKFIQQLQQQVAELTNRISILEAK